MVYPLTYRRPAHVDSSSASNNGSRPASVRESVRSGNNSISSGIPDALSFDRIISGGTCPPCTTRDFMNYLIYIEHAAENLQFFLWYQDYVKRFNALPLSERALATDWTVEKAEAEAVAFANNNAVSKKISPEAAEMFKGTDFAQPTATVKEVTSTSTNPFHTPPGTPSLRPSGERGWDDTSLTLKGSHKGSHQEKAATAFEAAEVKFQPFTIQPFREEISRIVAIYISEDGSRQLNLASKERAALLRALAVTTHPSAFRNVLHTVEWSLRHQSHPNFIRWTICNGNRPRVIFARGLGIFCILAGILTDILITISHAGRGWRVLPVILWLLGTATFIAGYKGMCVVLHGMHHRHLRPWELFADEDDESSVFELKKGFYEGATNKNSYEDEPWVAKYEKRNIIRKVFDREIWIQEPALRQIQDTIFIQALLGGFVVAAILVAIFVSVPKGNLI